MSANHFDKKPSIDRAGRPRTKNTRFPWLGFVFLGAFFVFGGFALVSGAVLPYLHFLNHGQWLPDTSLEKSISALIVGGIFVLLSSAFIYLLLRGRRDNVKKSTVPQLTPDALVNTSQTLKPSQLSKTTFVFFLVFSVIWNGIIGYIVATDFSPMILIFVGFGVVSVVVTVWTGLSLFNPKVSVTIHDLPLYSGSKAQISWRIEGRVQRLNDFSLTLVGEERATYKRGTDTYTDTHVFYEDKQTVTLAEVSNGGGAATIEIPNDTMHTWKSHNNEIVWYLRFDGEISRWPDLKETFDLTLYPSTH